MKNWRNLTVLVIGEAMLDCYLHGSSDRTCPEAPVPIVNVTQRQDAPGGAANTAANVASLGAKALLLSAIGNDSEGDRLRTALAKQHISTAHLLTSAHRITLAKQRVVANSQLLLRVDQGSTAAIAPDLEQQLLHRLVDLFQRCDGAIVSDYGYGILTPRVIQTLAALQAQHPRPLVVDSKNLRAYQTVGATVVKPNYAQAIRLLGLSHQSNDRQQQLISCGDRLLDLSGAQIVALTLDQDGAIVFERARSPHYLSVQPAPSSQTSGAGDTFVSAFALALAAGASTKIAATIASAAAAIVVQHPGTTVCSLEALRRWINVEFAEIKNYFYD
jgi:D-beta-D-heptose 7-phosphate kinase/D-beta-D-heptose 1-phosphate adenosyltransferase